MSNVYEIPAGTRIKYKRELAPHWLTDKALGATQEFFPSTPNSGEMR